MTRCVCGARGRLGGYAPKSGTRSIMISSMRDNVVGDVVDGNVTSKVGDVGDNGGMTCGAKVSQGGVEYIGDMKVWEGGVEYSCGIGSLGGWYGSLINGTTWTTTTSLTNSIRSTTTLPTTSPSPLTLDRLHPNCSG